MSIAPVYSVTDLRKYDSLASILLLWLAERRAESRTNTYEQNTTLSIPPNSTSQHRALHSATEMRKSLDVHRMVDSSGVLLDQRALVEISRGKMRGCTNQLDASIMSLRVRFGASKRRQEGMVDVDGWCCFIISYSS